MTQSFNRRTTSQTLGKAALISLVIGIAMTYSIWHRIPFVPMLFSFCGPLVILVAIGLGFQAMLGNNQGSPARLAGKSISITGIVIAGFGALLAVTPFPDGLGIVAGLYFFVPAGLFISCIGWALRLFDTSS